MDEPTRRGKDKQRAEHLAAALRENLRRRKAQARGRMAAETSEERPDTAEDRTSRADR